MLISIYILLQVAASCVQFLEMLEESVGEQQLHRLLQQNDHIVTPSN
jgi:hypothetical protein